MLKEQSIKSISQSARLNPPPYETYNMQFEAAGAVNNWNDRDEATALVTALREPAVDLLRTQR